MKGSGSNSKHGSCTVPKYSQFRRVPRLVGQFFFKWPPVHLREREWRREAPTGGEIPGKVSQCGTGKKLWLGAQSLQVGTQGRGRKIREDIRRQSRRSLTKITCSLPFTISFKRAAPLRSLRFPKKGNEIVT